MRVPLSWLREYVDLPPGTTGRALAERLIRVGLEVETVHRLGVGIVGPVVVGQVRSVEELTGFKKPIRYCLVDVGEPEPRGIVCGATNFEAGDKVVVSLPGAVLPGGFAIAARATYGRLSDGMICSARELGIGEDHAGIVVLPPSAEIGSDAPALLGLPDDVLDIAVTPDRGYCLSLRGVAREAATAYGVSLRDPALLDVPGASSPGYPVRIEDPDGCDVFVARTVRGVDRFTPSPLWLQQRINAAGMRPISLVVDVTNYVMLELGQPLHAYDAELLAGPIVVREAVPGERITTLDGAERALDPGDVVIADANGPIGLAGVMGGSTTEISGVTSDVVIEAAHFDAVAIARTSRRHKISTEASRRFERGVDPWAARAAAQRTVDLLTLLGGGEADEGITEVGTVPASPPIRMVADHPARVAGTTYAHETVVHRLQEIGCSVEGIDELVVTPPSWRPDLTQPADLAEEVIRLEGYAELPAELPQVPAGHGYTREQRLRRRAGQTLAGEGYVEVLCYPFVGEQAWEAFGLPEDDPRRITLRLANPLSDAEPLLRTTLLPGLLAALRRNISRGTKDVALFESAAVFLPDPHAPAPPRLPVDRRPTAAEFAALEAALPDQPRHAAVVLAGDRVPAGWWGSGRAVSWADAIAAAQAVALAVDSELTVRQGTAAPWHPGRCAELLHDGVVIGHAGELHPRAVAALGLPDRTAAMELDLDRLIAGARGIVPAPSISTFPPATQDVALITDAKIPAADIADALREGAGELLESLELFDVYTGEQIGDGRRSLAYTLRFRAPDRTLTADEVSVAREAAVALAAQRTGAVVRGG